MRVAYYWAKEVNLKSLHTAPFQLMMCWKRPNYEDSKEISLQGLGGGRHEEVEHRGFLGTENSILCDSLFFIRV